MENSNYCHTSQMTDDELRNVYLKMNKKQLVEMLIQNNKIINLLLENNNSKQETFYPLETIPTYQSNKPCKTWSDCTNPHYDCINCPLRYNVDSGFNTSASTQVIN